jgi:hypothetical protein
MPALPVALATVMGACAPLVSTRVFEHATLWLVGAMLAPGRRTGAAVWRVMGKSQDGHCQTDHRARNRARWSPITTRRVLLGLLLDTCVPEGPVVIGIEEPIERRRGAKLSAQGVYRDPVRSSPAHVVNASGLRGVSLLVLARLPWVDRVWALPCLTVLAPSARDYHARGRRPHALPDRARQAVRWVRRRRPTREVVVVGDRTYAALEGLDALRESIGVIPRLRLDAALSTPAPPRKPRQNGRPRKKGLRLPTLAQRVADPTTRWQMVTVVPWYGQEERCVYITSATAVWYHSGMPSVPIRWVLIRDPAGTFAPQALRSTTLALDPRQILTWFVPRWQLEATVEEARAPLGLETSRQWHDRSVHRTTPAVFGLDAIVTLVAAHLIKDQPAPIHPTAWYPMHRRR